MTHDRLPLYALWIQAIISLVVLGGSFSVIWFGVRPAVDQTAGNLILFVAGVWLGRGIDYGISRIP